MNNQPISTSTILEKLQWRYAVKKFDAQKKISQGDWNLLAESLRLTPSSYGLQPWKFLVVMNPEVRKQLTPLSWNQTQVEDCSHYVVLATKTKMDEAHIEKFVQKTASIRGIPASNLDGYKKMMISDVVTGPRSQVAKEWAQRQVYIAMGMLMETAALINVDTCPMEGLDPAAYDKVLKLEGSGWGTVAAVACGYRSADDPYAAAKKSRFDLDDLVQII